MRVRLVSLFLVRRPANSFGGHVYTKRALLESQLSLRELADALRRTSTDGHATDLNSQLRALGVDTLHFACAPNGVCRITSPGFEIRPGGRGTTVAVEGRLRILARSSVQNRPLVELKLVPTRRTLLGNLIWPCLVLGLILWSDGFQGMLADPVSFLLFFLLIGCLAPAFYLLRARALIHRMWPGLLAEAQRMTDGIPQLPAA